MCHKTQTNKRWLAGSRKKKEEEDSPARRCNSSTRRLHVKRKEGQLHQPITARSNVMTNSKTTKAGKQKWEEK